MSVFDIVACRLCACTDMEGCPDGCWWVQDPAGEGDLCSSCLELAERLLEVTSVLEATRFVWSTEDELQAGIAAAFSNRGLDVEREVRVDAHNRLDLQVGRIGIEVKLAGSWRDVGRQLTRYAQLDSIDALVLVTSKASHRKLQQLDLGGKPLVIHGAGSTL